MEDSPDRFLVQAQVGGFMTRPSPRALLATVGLTAALATTVRAQDQPSPPVFEVAAIKPHNP